ncbi:BTB/POZ domain-containing protein kctd3 [Balamuthia mandrillaris]
MATSAHNNKASLPQEGLFPEVPLLRNNRSREKEKEKEQEEEMEGTETETETEEETSQEASPETLVRGVKNLVTSKEQHHKHKSYNRGSKHGHRTVGTSKRDRMEDRQRRRSMELQARYKQQQQERMVLVKLNIGGWKYTTTKATLTNMTNGSFFSALMTGDIPSTLDEEGAYFTFTTRSSVATEKRLTSYSKDREGRYFEPILNFMRTGELIIPPTMSREAVKQEADFYCVTPVVRALNSEDSDACGGKLFNYMTQDWHSTVTQMVAMENHIVVVFEDGYVLGYIWNIEQGWRKEFECDYFLHTSVAQPLCSSTEASVSTLSATVMGQAQPSVHSKQAVEKVALFAQGSRWFVAIFAGRTLYVWNQQEKIGEIETKCYQGIDMLFFVRKGQNLVAVNFKLGQVVIASLASLSLRNLSTQPASISVACHDTGHVASWCCSAGVVYQLMIGHNHNTCLQELYRDPEREEITVIVNREQRTLFYGTAKGTIRRLDFPSSEFGGPCQSTLILSGHIHPIKELLPLGNRTLVSMCNQGHVRCWNNYDVTQMNSYSCSPDGKSQMSISSVTGSYNNNCLCIEVIT